MPGSTPATSQLDWLISTTAMIVLSWSRGTRDLLKSFGWGIRALHQLDAATMVPSPRRLPHTISPLEGRSFSRSPVYGELGATQVRKKSPACLGAEEFICCQGEHGSKWAKRCLIGVSVPSASAGFGRVGRWS